MRITIPECKEVFGDDGDNNRTFLYVQIQLMIMVRGLHEQYHHLGIGEPDYAETAIIDDAVRALSSFYTLADLRQDYNSCAVILRSLVDKIAVLKLIYANPNEHITDKEFQELDAQMEGARINTRDSISFITSEIQNHQYFNENPDWVRTVIGKKKIWQYREKFRYDSSGKKVPSYSWKEMYKLIDNREGIASFYSAYLSQFVHAIVR